MNELLFFTNIHIFFNLVTLFRQNVSLIYFELVPKVVNRELVIRMSYLPLSRPSYTKVTVCSIVETTIQHFIIVYSDEG